MDGEDNKICHQVRDGKVFARPPVSARHDVVIVGGGVSGLTAAYLLRHRDFLLLEKEPHWGGNAYLMEYQGAAYATGSAFLAKSEHAYNFAREIGLEPLPIANPDGSILKGEWIPDTWGSGLDKLPYPASVRESFKKFKKEMLAINVQKRASELYSVPFSDFLKGYPEELKQWWERLAAIPQRRLLSSHCKTLQEKNAKMIVTPGPEGWVQSPRNWLSSWKRNSPTACGQAPQP